MWHFVIVSVWRGESRAPGNLIEPRDGGDGTRSMVSVCISLISPQLFLLLCAKARQPIRAPLVSRSPTVI